MSCLGKSYLPQPPRVWNRFENSCAYRDLDFIQGVFTDEEVFAPFFKKNILKSEFAYELAVYKKGNILQYKKNSANITKLQRYAQIAKGYWTNRTTTWASQSDTYSNPNTQSLKRVNYGNITTNGNPTNEAINCPPVPTPPINNTLPSIGAGGPTPPIIPPPPPTPAGNIPVLPPLINPVQPIDIVIPDGGNLVCSIVEDFCTGQILKLSTSTSCNSTTASDVPGKPITLCFNDGLSTYYPKVRNTYASGGGKWPDNAKFTGTTIYVPPSNV